METFIMKFNKLALVSLLGVTAAFSAGNAHATLVTYTDRTTFLSLLQPGYLEDAFNDVTNGGIQGASSTRSGGGFSVTYTAPTGGLYSATGAMSTNLAANNLVVTMGGSNIYAVGGYFYLTDINGNFQAFTGHNISAFAANSIDRNAPLSAVNAFTNFFVWISSTPITSVTVNAGSATAPIRWNTLDNFIVGAPAPVLAPVPEPGILALLALGGAALVRRRQKSA